MIRIAVPLARGSGAETRYRQVELQAKVSLAEIASCWQFLEEPIASIPRISMGGYS
jgi:hypothetical protein